jgi:hypothetical protein
MAEYCSNCFEKLDALHMCGSSASEGRSNSSGGDIWSTNQSLHNFVIAAPLMGVVLDLVLPFPSSLIHSAIVSVLGSALAAAVWVGMKYQGQKSLKFFAFNLKNFLYTPNILKIFGSSGNKKATPTWLAVIAASTVLQVIMFTPGNSAYLSSQITKQIHQNSGATLKTECPKAKVYFYNEEIECRVRTGLLGITVPARVSISPILGSSEIKVSLF